MEQNEELVLKDIERISRTWLKEAHWLQILLGALGFFGVVGTLLVPALIGTISQDIVRILACIAPLCLSLIAAFNLLSKNRNYITAWRLLNKAIYSFRAEIINIEDLLNVYEEGERMLGTVDFHYSGLKQAGNDKE